MRIKCRVKIYGVVCVKIGCFFEYIRNPSILLQDTLVCTYFVVFRYHLYFLAQNHITQYLASCKKTYLLQKQCLFLVDALIVHTDITSLQSLNATTYNILSLNIIRDQPGISRYFCIVLRNHPHSTSILIIKQVPTTKNYSPNLPVLITPDFLFLI